MTSEGDTNFPTEFTIKSYLPKWNYFFYRHVQLGSLNGKNLEFGGFSIGYDIHDTSELTDNQVLSFSPVGTIPLPLCPVRYLWMAGFRVLQVPIGYVHFTSEL